MIPLPVPYEDELFFSTLCRLHKRLDRPATTTFCKALFGAGTVNPGTTIPLHLDELNKEFPEGYPLTPELIMKRHSLEPFILGFVSWSNKRKCRIQTTLKSCPECSTEDISTFGEDFWHVSHQVEGVNYCPKHSVVLDVDRRPALKQAGGRSYRPDFHLPSETTFAPSGGGDKEIQLGFFGMVKDILDGKNLPWKIEQSSLLGELERQDYTAGLQIKGWKVLDEGRKRFGDEMGRLFHIPHGERGRRTITNIVTEEDPAPHRILFLHALLKLPVWKEVEPALRKPVDFRLKRKGRERVSAETHQRRKAFLKLIRKKLPSDASATNLFREVKRKDQKWLGRLQEERELKQEKAKEHRKQMDPTAANLVRKVAAELRAEMGRPSWIRKGTIIRKAGVEGRIITLCQNEPLTQSALEHESETQEALIQRRIEWGRQNAPANAAEYEFRAVTGLRGLKEKPPIPGVLTRSAKKAARLEKLSQMKAALDPTSAKLVRDAVTRIENRKGRPVWITLPEILREVGSDSTVVQTCLTEPETSEAVRNSLDIRETITKKRLEWAAIHHPEILKMSPYFKMDALGLRVTKNRRRKKKTLKNAGEGG
jgi:hypothetical protein